MCRAWGMFAAPRWVPKGCAKCNTFCTPAQKPSEQRDNHRPGCWIANLVTIHRKGRNDVGSRQDMAFKSDGDGFIALASCIFDCSINESSFNKIRKYSSRILLFTKSQPICPSSLAIANTVRRKLLNINIIFFFVFTF